MPPWARRAPCSRRWVPGPPSPAPTPSRSASPSRHPCCRRPAYPAGLSAREVEVLHLLAAGRTNREIAEALFLSERTIHSHVRTILTKTGADNRAAAAAFALRHRLA